MMARVTSGLAAALALLVLPISAQADSLADIRAELGSLYGTITGLRGELVASGQASAGVAGNTPLERLDAIESALQRLTSRTEELENRINRITTDGTNRIGDLEFRICELEPGCDISMLGDTPSLGGVDNAAGVPQASPSAPTGPELTAGEQQDYRRAQEALAQGDFQRAADLFAAYVAAWPGSPLTGEALFHQGEALEGLGRISDAARAWLDSFSGAPDGPMAPDALVKLGSALAAMGQTADACVTLGEVPLRFPTHPAAAQAQSERSRIGCR